MKSIRLNSAEKVLKINLQNFNQRFKQTQYTKSSDTVSSYKDLLPSVNYFGAGSSEEDRAFKDFFTQY